MFPAGGCMKDVPDKPGAESASTPVSDREDERLLALLDALPTSASIATALDQSVLYANAAWLRLLGISSMEEARGRTVQSFMAPESADRARESLARAKATGEFPRADRRYRLIRPDGARIDVEIAGAPAMFGGQPAIVSILTDVTGEEQARRDAEESEVFGQAIIGSIPIGMHFYRLEDEGRLVFTGANPAADDILGIDHSTLVGMDILQAFPDLAGGGIPEVYRRLARESGSWHEQSVYYEDDRVASSFDVNAFHTGAGTMVAAFTDITERVRAQSDLERANTLMSAIFASMPDGFSLLDADGRHVSVNPALCRMTGFTEDELVGVGPPHPYWPPEELEVIGESFAKTLRDEATDFDLTFMRKNGERFPVLLTPAVIRDADGTMVSAFSIVRDMTERKRAEEALSRETQRLQAHIDNSPLASVEFDSSSRITRWSESAMRMFGWTADEVLGKRVIGDFPWVHEDDVGRVEDLSSSMVTGDQPWTVHENRNYRKDGSLIDCVWYNTVLEDNEGRVVALMSRVLDVTAARSAERALRESEERYRSVVASLHEGVILQAADGQILAFNQTASDIFGIGQEAALGETSTSRDWGTIREDGSDFPGEEHPSMVTLRTGRPCTDVVMGVRGPSGLRWIEISTEPMQREGESLPSAVVISFTDVTARRQAEADLRSYKEGLERIIEERTRELTESNKALEEASRAKSQFLASMSHELRTPLNSIIGFSGIMLQGLTGELTSEQRAQLEMVNRAGRQLLGLVSDVLDLERIEAGRVELELEDVDVRRLAVALADTIRPLAQDVGLSVELDLESAPVSVHTDRSKLEQILLNFLSNSVKYTEVGGITLSVATRDDGTVAFAVRDTGIGIAAQDQASVFQEFRQLPAHRSAKHPGSGLGLAISTQLAEVIEGRIELESTPGEGSTFTLVLPPSAVA